MRVKKSLINSSVTIFSYIATFLPVFILRKVFLNELGNELMGLSSLFENIIGYLSIAEMGIGTAIIFSLYKPFAERDFEKVKAYLSYYKRFYFFAGIIIVIIGLCITPILGIFLRNDLKLLDVKLYFILFLINTLISYLFSYKQCILNVAQEGYKLSIATTLSKLIIVMFQIIIIKVFKSFYLYILTQIIVNLIYYVLINFYIDNKYNFLDIKSYDLSQVEKKNLTRNIKALFFHKIGSVLVFGTDNIVLSTFINLTSVAKYTNYSIIINVFNGIIGNSLNAITPSIGNLLVDGDKNKAYDIHKKIMFYSFWISSFVVISLFNTLTQFIALWLGEGSILNQFTVGVILVNVYFQMMKGSVGRFKEGAGEYHKDRFAPLIEGLINLVSSIILVNLIGMPGVFIGTFISNITVIFWTQPSIVYKYVFNIPVINYYKEYFRYLFIAIIPLLLTTILTYNLKNIYSPSSFILNCLINIVIINTSYIIIFNKNEEFIYFKELLVDLLKGLLRSIMNNK